MSAAANSAAVPPCTVTVVVATYNHVRTIGAAIESALAQRLEEPVEIIVSEDRSTDGTREIVEAMAARSPDRIRTLLSTENLHSNEVIARALRAARGRYVALLDGDDLWTDPDRLRRQVAFLDAHPDCAAVFMNALVAEGDRVTDRRWTRADLPPRFGPDEIWAGNPYATCAGLLRRSALLPVPDWYAGFFPVTDWPLYVLAARHGWLAFLDEPVGVYRLHADGLYSRLSEDAKLTAVERFYRRMIAEAGPDFADRARRGGARFFLDWAEAFLERGEPARAWSCLARSLRFAVARGRLPSRRAFGLGLDLVRRAVRSA
ncbi:glycosyltransferase [Prosthecomicrobium sp. N25]|uniref:glycosyltransferase n=1 Tax=Prosthecomicrobium sp. N25 TaxID=3129254 RepID=UPI0030787B56